MNGVPVYLQTGILLSLSLACAQCTTVPDNDGWVHQGEALSEKKERQKFVEDWQACNEKRELAEESIAEFDLKADPDGAFELCMRTKGWQPSSEVSP